MPSNQHLAFVLEQSLGHRAHARNLERELTGQAGFESTIIHVEPGARSAVNQLPGLRSWSAIASLAARRRLVEVMSARRVDALFIHTQVAALAVTDLMRRVPTVVSLDATPRNFDSQAESYNHSLGSRPTERLKWLINRRAFRSAAALVTWCRWAADSLIADYGVPPERITVVHPGVDTRLFKPRPAGAANSRLRALFVGGDFVRKGGPDVVAAVAGLGELVEVDLVTSAQVTRTLEGAGCRVHCGLGPHSKPLLDLYARADVLLLPSRGDCFPQAVAEAMACGIPVIATHVGAIPEMVQHGVTGLLIPPRDPDALRAALRLLIENPEARARMGDAALLYARRSHDASRNNRTIIELLRGLGEKRAMRGVA